MQPLFSRSYPYQIILGPISDYLETVPLPHSYWPTPKCEKGTMLVGFVPDGNYDRKKHLNFLFCFTVCVMIVQQMVTFGMFRHSQFYWTLVYIAEDKSVLNNHRMDHPRVLSYCNWKWENHSLTYLFKIKALLFHS